MPFVQAGDLRIRYELTGEKGPVLVFSNSLGTDLSMWDPQVAKLGQRFRILRYDTRGHGQSSVTPGDHTIEQLGRDVLALLDALKLERVHFCGLSMGGLIGMWLGVHAPDRLNRLVLCNTAARIGTNEMWNARIATARKEGMNLIAASVIERWFTPEFRSSSPDQVAQTRRMLETASPTGYASCCAALRDVDLRDAIPEITAPTLIIYGTKDPVTTATDANFMAERITGSKKVELNAAHLSNIEQAALFTEAVGTFLSR